MPFAPHIRITALGRLGNSSGERFSYGVNMHAPADDRIVGLDANQSVWADVAADVRAFHTRGATALAETAVLETVKVASIGADGRYTGDPVIIDVVDANGQGGISNVTLPQAALAVSLGTARRGPTGRGRFYLPMPIIVLSPDTLLMDAPKALAIQGSAATFINALNNQPGIDVLGLQVCVSSTKGYNSTVTTLRVGRVVDTMRSRRNALPESYGTATAIV